MRMAGAVGFTGVDCKNLERGADRNELGGVRGGWVVGVEVGAVQVGLGLIDQPEVVVGQRNDLGQLLDRE